jgi:2,3,4,5-tetrahydropyridine-2,6-dicarboxylate N-succinyltransferase
LKLKLIRHRGQGSAEPSTRIKPVMTSFTALQLSIEEYFASGPAAIANPDAMQAFLSLRSLLESGELRSASPDADAPTGWRVNAWVKQGILLGFRLGVLVDFSLHELAVSGPSFVDKHTYPARHFTAADGIRVVPGGSSVRSGAYVARGVVCMPPMYINAGAYVDEGTMVDSHALVGSCAQIGKRVHLSAAAQIGGVLEPINASPVVIEDDVLVGGNSGVYEGTIVQKGAVLAAGTILTRGTPVFDLVHGTVLRATDDLPLIIPENAVLVPGSRALSKGKGQQWGLSLYAPVIVKYRDDKTSLSTTLEELLR